MGKVNEMENISEMNFFGKLGKVVGGALIVTYKYRGKRAAVIVHRLFCEVVLLFVGIIYLFGVGSMIGNCIIYSRIEPTSMLIVFLYVGLILTVTVLFHNTCPPFVKLENSR